MPFTVETYESPEQVETALGVVMLPYLDEQQLQTQLNTGDAVVVNGSLFTIIVGGFPADTQILGKGIYYTVIVETT